MPKHTKKILKTVFSLGDGAVGSICFYVSYKATPDLELL